MKNTHKKICQASRFSEWDLKVGTSEYETGVLITRPRGSVEFIIKKHTQTDTKQLQTLTVLRQ
jgi:hypothetical protein